MDVFEFKGFKDTPLDKPKHTLFLSPVKYEKSSTNIWYYSNSTSNYYSDDPTSAENDVYGFKGSYF